jgi:Uma2 family endonuclease
VLRAGLDWSALPVYAAREHLDAGVPAVILVYPDSQHVHVHRPRGEARRFGAGDMLEIPELLPGFKLSIDELFR